MTRAYRSELRDQQAALTRERLIDATRELLRTIRPVDLSYAEIADAAAVSRRTVYRHFPSPDDLFGAVAARIADAIVEGGDLANPTLEDATELLLRQYRLMERDPAVFRAFFALPIDSRHGGGRRYYEVLFGDWVGRLPEADRAVALGLLDLVASPYAWDVLHSRWGADADHAHRASIVAIRAIQAFLDQHPDALDPNGPALLSQEDR